MEISYKRKANASYMVIAEALKQNEHEEQMLKYNEIKALLPQKQVEINGRVENWYEISKKESLRDYFEIEELDIEKLKKLIKSINYGLEELDKYLICQDNILLGPDTVFIEKNGESSRVSLCYCPAENEPVKAQFRTILEHFMADGAGMDKECQSALYKIYELTLKNDYTFEELIEFLDEKEELPAPFVEKIEMKEETDDYLYESPVATSDGEYLSDYYDEPEEESIFEKISSIFFKHKEEKMKSRLIKEDFIIEPDVEISEPTVLLHPDDYKCVGKLIYNGEFTEDNFVVGRENFLIGTDKKCDGLINSKTVSHHHARITKEKDDFYLEDMNSLNGTKLNGKSLNYKEKIKLHPSDNIMFGNVAYLFM